MLFESRALEGGANSLRSKLSHWRVAPIARRVSERSSRILLSPAPFSLNVLKMFQAFLKDYSLLHDSKSDHPLGASAFSLYAIEFIAYGFILNTLLGSFLGFCKMSLGIWLKNHSAGTCWL